MAEPAIHKVLLTGDTVGGVWTFTLDLAAGLIENGMEVCLATFGRTPLPAQQDEAAAIPGLQWFDSSFKLEWMDNPWTDVQQSGGWVRDIARRFNPDLIHLNTLAHGALDWNAPVVMTVHSCVTSWWAAVKQTPLPSSWQRYRSEVERSLRCADLVTAPSRAMLSSTSVNYGLPFEDGRVVPNGRRAAQFRIEPKQPFILAAGRLWDEGKNMPALTKIAPSLPWPVFLAGDDRDPDGAPARLPGCRWLGQLTSAELASWYAQAAIYALPARYEPFGLSVLEAALSGCALVLGDIPSLREVWNDAAIFVRPDDSARLQSALQDLIENPEMRRTMAARAFSQAQRYTPTHLLAGYLNAYDLARQRASQRRLACAS